MATKVEATKTKPVDKRKHVATFHPLEVVTQFPSKEINKKVAEKKLYMVV